MGGTTNFINNGILSHRARSVAQGANGDPAIVKGKAIGYAKDLEEEREARNARQN